MKRKPLLEFDSLELLLDTICNTFGGILFLAVLVIMLVHHTGEGLQRMTDAHSADPDIQVRTAELQQRQATLRSLQQALDEYRNNLNGLASNQSVSLASRVLALRRDLADLNAQRAERLGRVAQLSQEKAAADNQIQDIATRLTIARKDRQTLEEQIANERKTRTRTVSLPMLRETTKHEFPIIVRFGRLYVPFTAENGLQHRRSNLSNFVILDDTGPVIRATPKPYAGLPLKENNEMVEELGKTLGRLDNESVYLAIGVWEDSFEHFQFLKDAIVKLGFEYRLVPIASGEFIQEAPVKETLVQ